MATSKKKSRVDELGRENGTELSKEDENQAQIGMGEEDPMDQDVEESSDSESDDDSEQMEIEEVSKPQLPQHNNNIYITTTNIYHSLT